MLALLITALSHFSCPVGILAHGVQPDGSAGCYVDTADGVVLVSRTMVLCRKGSVPIVELDGRSVRCRRLAVGTNA